MQIPLVLHRSSVLSLRNPVRSLFVPNKCISFKYYHKPIDVVFFFDTIIMDGCTGGLHATPSVQQQQEQRRHPRGSHAAVPVGGANPKTPPELGREQASVVLAWACSAQWGRQQQPQQQQQQQQQ